MTSLLSVKSLRTSVAKRSICRDLDLTVNSGECWGILGVNGIGKTTLLHTLAGLREFEAGEIHYLGNSLASINRVELAKQRGILFQDNADPFPATVLETVLIGRHPYIKTWQWETAEDIALARKALQRVDLTGLENRYINTLSGGERQRVAIATLIVQQPKVYLLDEPINHLDIRHQIRIMQLFDDLKNQGHAAIIMILHDLNLAMRFCDHILMLFDDGETRKGPVHELLTTESLEALYGYPIHRINDNSQTVFIPA
ncbi:ABC transporter ATP-binding protein [Kaarinaea lacus]